MAGGSSNGSVSGDEWVDVQKNTFQRWANSHLSKKRMEMDDLYEDLKDGIRLIALLQIISRQKVCPKFNKKPKMRIQKLENLNLAFKFMQTNGVTVTNIGSSDILDGNNKLVLGLLWTIIKSYQVAEIAVDGVSGKDGLLLWCKRSLADYPEIVVRNFTTSWTNGMAFCALIHKFYPTLIDFNALSPDNSVENVTLAFQIATDKFKIPQLLNVNDVANNSKTDEKSILTYVSLLFQEFASGMQKKKAINTISKAVNIAQRINELKAFYAVNATQLFNWYHAKYDFLNDNVNNSITSVSSIQSLLNQIQEYKQTEKPSKEALYVELEGCVGRLQSICTNNHREPPVLTPKFDLISEKRHSLHALEIEKESELRAKSIQFQQTESILKKITLDLDKFENWLQEKHSFFHSDNLFVVQSALEAEEVYEHFVFFKDIEIPRYENIITQIEKNSENILNQNATSDVASANSTIQDTITRIADNRSLFDTVHNTVDKLFDEMKFLVSKQKELDRLVKEVTLVIRDLKYTLEEIDEEIDQSSNSLSTELELSEINARFDHYMDQIYPKVETVLASPKETLLKNKSILEEGKRTQDVANIDKFMTKMEALIEKRDSKKLEFTNCLDRSKQSHELMAEFASVADKVMKEISDIGNALNTKTELKLNEQLNSIKALQELINDGVTSEDNADDTESVSEPSLIKLMEKLDTISLKLEEYEIFGKNLYTNLNIATIRAQYNSLQSALLDRMTSIEKEISIQQLGHITPQQITEFHEVFTHFDIDNDGYLARDEFIMACKGLGFDLSENECHDLFDSFDSNHNDEINEEEFIKFSSTQLESGSTKDDVLNAFEILAGESYITNELMNKYFDTNMKEYMVAQMKVVDKSTIALQDDVMNGEEDESVNDTTCLDYQSFSADIFQT